MQGVCESLSGFFKAAVEQFFFGYKNVAAGLKVGSIVDKVRAKQTFCPVSLDSVAHFFACDKTDFLSGVFPVKHDKRPVVLDLGGFIHP